MLTFSLFVAAAFGLPLDHDHESLDLAKTARRLNFCCKALTAGCLACEANISVSDYCRRYPSTPGCNTRPNPGVTCPTDTKYCSDGARVSRDPHNGCNFRPCPGPVVTCPTDTRSCPNGQHVSRDPHTGCHFRPCHSGPVVTCPTDIRTCPNGQHVSRDPNNGCQFPRCPSGPVVTCPTDVHICPNGQHVSRDPNNGCQFPRCPSGPVLTCPTDTRSCPNGEHVSRDPNNGCQFPRCPSGPVVTCPTDVHICPNGEHVSRDPNNGCQFQCPSPICCQAFTASCESCKARQTPEEYCRAVPDRRRTVPGCQVKNDWICDNWGTWSMWAWACELKN